MRKDFERAHVVAHGTVAVLTLNHPETLNAASVGMVGGLTEALRHVSDPQSGFRALVITGEGRGFCSGANLADADPSAVDARDTGNALETAYHPLLRRLRDLNMPIVTAVNGAAAGIGMSIALMGDIIIATRSAYFLQAFARIGLVPDGGSTWLLPRLIGLARARELSLLAEKLPAQTALEWGLINRVCDDATLIDDALALARRLADGPTATLAMIRQLYRDSPNNSYEVQIDLERQMQQRAGRTEDFIEGVTAFLQKRPAKFRGH
ncbi:MAG: enoyl-CoA hydratase/isomerase [Alphaproteobacteria bacterium]|nr:enoyl-CoA hydratase/isomerase [Alphaproteobacteria bacterium]MDE2353321.1 enoyl-CoA hydratase/isomerase [Alphaproteobacteria bacterium]